MQNNGIIRCRFRVWRGIDVMSDLVQKDFERRSRKILVVFKVSYEFVQYTPELFFHMIIVSLYSLC